MAIGKIKGPMLFDNLDRQGVNLSFDGNLLYLDVTNRRLGVGTSAPLYGLDVPANVRLANLTILNDSITSNTGSINLGSTNNVKISGGTPYDVLYTDGNGNLAFGNLNSLSSFDGFTGDNIALGSNSLGSLTNAVSMSTSISVTDGIALLNQLLGNITDATGSTIHVTDVNASGNITADGNLRANYLLGDGSLLSGVSAPITISEYFYGDISNVMPHVSTIRFDRATGFTVEDLGANTALISMASSFKTWIVDGQANLVAFGEDKIKFAVDNNIVITTHPDPDPLKTITFSLANSISVLGDISAGYITATEGFSTANAQVTGGSLTGLTEVSATAGTFTNLSSSNVLITGGSLSGLTEVSATTGTFTNLSSANVIINSGYADNFPIGANIAAPGRFTTLEALSSAIIDGNLVAGSGTASTNTTTGALVVVGGAGISGNLNVTNISSTQINSTTGIIDSLYSTSIITNDLSTTAANIGTMLFADSTITSTSPVIFNSNTAIKLPIGNSVERPAGQNGFLRFNTDLSSIEYFDGGSWVPVTNTVTDQIIDYCDGVTDTFTLDREASPASVIVSINGTLQQPEIAYTIINDGTQIQFYETPEATDVIDIRFLGASVAIASTLSDDLTVEGNLTINGSFSFGNLIPKSNVTYSLGNSTHQWKEIWVSGNTIYLGNAPLSINNGVLTVSGSAVASYGNANVAAYLSADGTIASLQSNAATQATQINSTNANVTVANSAILTLQSSLTSTNANVTAANASIVTLQMQMYANSNVNTYLSQNTIGSLSTSGNITVGGNLIVNGTTTTVNANNLIINDNIIYMASGNPGNSVDIGFAGHFNNGTYQHTGMVRQASSGQWKLFSNLIPEPGNTLDFTNVVYDPIQVGAITSPTITDLYANAATQVTTLASKAPLASPALTGTPTAPTANISVNNTQVATTAYVHNMLPSGVIMMWSGSSATIPYGWYLCDGLNGTPNLRDRFIVGAGSTYAVGATGGSADATLVSHSHTASSTTSTSISDPGHRHWISSAAIDDYNFTGTGNNTQDYGIVADAGSYSATDPNKGTGRYNLSATTGITAGSSTSTTVNATGNSATGANLPPYYALCYIMKS